MWTEITRPQYRRDRLRYASDTTDGEWAVIEGLMPAPHKGRGRRRTTSLRAVVNAIFYIAQSGCQWRMQPKDFPPFTTVQHYFYPWRDSGLWRQINHVLLMLAREAVGREASPSAGVIDSQSVKTTEAGGPRGYDAGKKIKGRKRHILTDTTGLLFLDAVPKRELEGDLVVGGQFGDRRRSGREFGCLSRFLGGQDLLFGRILSDAEAKRPDRVGDVLDQLLA
jgi:transposase